MIRKSEAFRQERMANMFGGDGIVTIEHLWEPETEMLAANRLCARILLEAGHSIGYHMHQNEEELYFIVSGRAKVNDNGSQRILKPGDAMLTRSGEGHAIATLGDETLVILAVVSVYDWIEDDENSEGAEGEVSDDTTPMPSLR